MHILSPTVLNSRSVAFARRISLREFTKGPRREDARSYSNSKGPSRSRPRPCFASHLQEQQQGMEVRLKHRIFGNPPFPENSEGSAGHRWRVHLAQRCMRSVPGDGMNAAVMRQMPLGERWDGNSPGTCFAPMEHAPRRIKSAGVPVGALAQG